MPQCVCCVQASPRSAGDAAKLGQFIGQFSWVTGDPIGVKGFKLEESDVPRINGDDEH